MPERILHQVREHLHEKLPVAADCHVRSDVGDEVLSLIVRHRRIGVGDVAKDSGQLHPLERGAVGARFDLRDSQQRREHRQQLVDVLERAVEDGTSFRRPGSRRLEPMAQARQRGPQIVRDVARHLSHVPHQGLDPVQHPVEIRGQSIQLVAGALCRDAV